MVGSVSSFFRAPSREAVHERVRIIVATCGIAALALPVLAHAQQSTNFDDLGFSCGPTLAAGYAGFVWSNMLPVTPGACLPGITLPSGYAAGVTSGANVAFNGSGDPGGFAAANLFKLTSIQMTGAWRDGLNVDVSGWLAGIQLFGSNLSLSATAPTLELFNWAGIDEVRFSSYGGVDHGYPGGQSTNFVMDDLIINDRPPAVMPEPASLTLVMTGLLGIGAVSRRRRKR